MAAPNELSFLPDDYLERKARRRANALCAGLSVIVMGAIAWAGQRYIDWPSLRTAPWIRAGALFGTIGACAAAYFAVLLALGFRPRDFKRRSA